MANCIRKSRVGGGKTPTRRQIQRTAQRPVSNEQNECKKTLNEHRRTFAANVDFTPSLHRNTPRAAPEPRAKKSEAGKMESWRRARARGGVKSVSENASFAVPNPPTPPFLHPSTAPAGSRLRSAHTRRVSVMIPDFLSLFFLPPPGFFFYRYWDIQRNPSP